ncbi:DMT family transporter [Streptomyces sp. MS19]|uniref:DMT family transporter n=1 Tax=Streptomyces sp. MS19 TaxID=3385972 RepID=UPI0039A3A977
MRVESSATAPAAIAVPPSATGGTVLAALGVVAFSLTFPATVWAMDGLGPWTTTWVRVTLAAAIAVSCLLAVRASPPARRHWGGLAVVAAGSVTGFPLLSTLALQTSDASHAAVVVGLLPLATAVYATSRAHSRPSPVFWIAAGAGAALVVGFTAAQSGGAPTLGDVYLFVAVLLCAAAYGEGARLSREFPGWQVNAWALLLSLPLAVPGLAIALLTEPGTLTPRAVTGVLWLAVGSGIVGLAVWYRGLARAGITRASQLQLAQPLLTLVWSVLLLGEHLPAETLATALGVLLCIAVTQRSRG